MRSQSVVSTRRARRRSPSTTFRDVWNWTYGRLGSGTSTRHNHWIYLLLNGCSAAIRVRGADGRLRPSHCCGCDLRSPGAQQKHHHHHNLAATRTSQYLKVISMPSPQIYDLDRHLAGAGDNLTDHRAWILVLWVPPRPCMCDNTFTSLRQSVLQ